MKMKPIGDLVLLELDEIKEKTKFWDGQIRLNCGSKLFWAFTYK